MRFRPLFVAGLVLLFAGCQDGAIPTMSMAPDGPLLSATSSGGVVISQVYGGGGNSGATLRNDFIELFNSGTEPVSLEGWSVQYASSGGSTWQVTALSGTIQPGGYYLVQEAAGAGGTVSLPTPDASGNIPMSASAGKVWLVRQTTALGGTCPAGATVVDHVSFGTSATNCGWGTTATLNNTTAALRADGGCRHTGNLSTDFGTGAPSPRNSASPTITCDVVPPPEVVSVSVSPTGASLSVGATQTFTATALDAEGQAIGNVVFTWSSSSESVATVSDQGVATGAAAGSATITATAPNGVSGSAELTVDDSPLPPAANVRVSEFHYDNNGADTGEAIELEGDQGGSLDGWRLVLYSGSTGSSTQGQSYATITLSGTFPSTCGTRGVLVFETPGLQNGDQDGFALVNAAGQVVEFLSYEGTFTATNGPAAGMTSTDVGVAQSSDTPAGRSLQRAGNGVWFGPFTHSFGACNRDVPPPPQTGITFSGRHPLSDPPLPVGFQDQLFATLRDASTNAVVETTFTWSSETPSIASVDQEGVMTALAAGTAVIRATAADGTTNTYSLPTRVATASSSAQYGHNTEFGEPGDADASDDHILRYPQFTSSFNRNRGTPNWVSYNIDATHFGGEDRCDCFTFDADLPGAFDRYTTAAYTGAGAFHGYGIDRGHLARSFDRTSGSLDNALTFYFSNIIPQAADNNQGPWAVMENHLGDLARTQNREVYVVAGVAGSKGTVKNEGRITIPAQVWKVALVMPRDRGLADVRSHEDVEVIAAIMPNEPGIRNVNWETYRTTVDAVEALSGYDVFAALPDGIERIVESGTRAPVARTDGPYTGWEGSAVSLSAAASSDPDGDALTYAWDFGDGTSGTGAAPTHTYADNGNYIVRVTVTDPYGAESTATTSVTVMNVAPTVHAFSGAKLLPGETYTASGTFADPGADAWSGTVTYAAGSPAQPLSLSGNGFTLSHTYASAGTFAVTVVITDDDEGAAQATAEVLVITQQQAIDELASTVRSLLDGAASSNRVSGILASMMSSGDNPATSLLAKLEAAKQSLNRNNEAAAVSQLVSFKYEIQALERSGRLTAERAARITAAADRIIVSIQR